MALDPIGWFIVTTHQLLGHDKTAAVLGVPVGDRACCLICASERHPTDETRALVAAALAPSARAALAPPDLKERVGVGPGQRAVCARPGAA